MFLWAGDLTLLNKGNFDTFSITDLKIDLLFFVMTSYFSQNTN